MTDQTKSVEQQTEAQKNEEHYRLVHDLCKKISEQDLEITRLKKIEQAEVVNRNDILEEAARVCDEKFNARGKEGFAREASTARNLAIAIRALKSNAQPIADQQYKEMSEIITLTKQQLEDYRARVIAETVEKVADQQDKK